MPRISGHSALHASRPALPSAVWEKLEPILARFEDAWRRGERPNVGDFLQGKGAPRLALLIELAHEDLDYRLRAGESVRATTYLERYPELRADPTVVQNLIVAEFELRQAQPGSTRPRWEDFLCQGDAADRPALLRQLLALDLHYRVGHGEQPNAEEYQRHLPEHATVIESVFGAFPTGAGTPPDAGFGGNPVVGVTASPAPRKSTTVSVPGYEVLGTLGEGGMGVVYKARQIKADRLVALKMILHGDHVGEAARERFRTEAQSIARLQHPHIVQIYEIGEVNGLPFFSLEFCPGGSLDKKLQGTPLPPQEAAALVETLARAMDAAHNAGVVHRDLKPANILLSVRAGSVSDGRSSPVAHASGSDWIPKITDFGLAKKVDEAGQTASGAVMGSPSYMAPEQADGRNKEVGPAADVYALGAILYECLTGRPPFKAATVMDTLMQVIQDEPVPPTRINAKVPRDLEVLCLKCLQKEARQRYGSALELAEDLRRFRGGEPIKARPVSTLERGAKWVKRNRGLSAALAAAVLALLVGTAVSAWQAVVANIAAANETTQRQAAETEKKIADAARKTAVTEKNSADAARKTAEDEKNEKDKQLNRAELLVYADKLSLAQRAFEDGNATLALQYLDECQWNLRGWEHCHLCTRFNSKRAFLTHKYVTSVAISADGKRIVSGSISRTDNVQVWDADNGQAVLTLKGHKKTVHSVATSANGNRIASVSEDGTVKMWDTVKGQEILSLKGHTDPYGSVAISADGKRIVAESQDGIKVWDAEKRLELVTLKEPMGLTRVAISADGKRIVTGRLDNTLKVWDATTGQQLLALKEPMEVTSVAISADGKRIVSGSGFFDNPGEVKVWDAVTGQEVLKLKGHTSGVKSVAVSADGKRIVSGSSDHTVKLWDGANGREIFTLKGHMGGVTSVAISADGKRIVSGGEDRTVRVWEADNVEGVPTLKGDTQRVLSVAISADGKRIVSGGGDTTVRVWDTAKGWDVLTLKGHVYPVYCVAISADGKRIISGDGGGEGDQLRPLPGEVKAWDADTGKEVLTLKGHTAWIHSVAISADGKRIVSGSSDQTVKVWDADNGQELLTLNGHTAWIRSVAISADRKRIISGSDDQTVKVWDADTGRELLTLKGHTREVQSVAISADGKRIVSGSKDQTVKVWDADTGQEMLTLKGHTSAVCSVAISADRKRIISGSEDQTVKVWDAGKGQEVLTLKGHTGRVNSVAISADGNRMVSGSDDKTVKLWEADRGQEMLILRGQAANLSSVGFMADGKRIVAKTEGGEIRSWDALKGQEITPCTDPPPPDGQREAVSPDGKLRVWADGANVRARRLDDAR